MFRNARVAVPVLCLMLVIGLSGVAFAQDAVNPKVKAAVDLLISKSTAFGVPNIQNGELYFGSTKMNGNFTVVDAVTKEMGCTATLFIKEDDNFMRVTTTVMVEGKRAVGTALDVRGKAYAALSSGNSFFGVIDVLGKKYDTAYEPIKDANSNIIGAYYVGFAL